MVIQSSNLEVGHPKIGTAVAFSCQVTIQQNYCLRNQDATKRDEFAFGHQITFRSCQCFFGWTSWKLDEFDFARKCLDPFEGSAWNQNANDSLGVGGASQDTPPTVGETWRMMVSKSFFPKLLHLWSWRPPQHPLEKWFNKCKNLPSVMTSSDFVLKGPVTYPIHLVPYKVPCNFTVIWRWLGWSFPHQELKKGSRCPSVASRKYNAMCCFLSAEVAWKSWNSNIAALAKNSFVARVCTKPLKSL